MVNAFDSGLRYVTVDSQKSKNVDFSYDNQYGNIASSIYSYSGYFHVGSQSKNNLSGSDSRGRVKLAKKGSYTKIYFKLWMQNPEDVRQKEDFAYVITIQGE